MHRQRVLRMSRNRTPEVCLGRPLSCEKYCGTHKAKRNYSLDTTARDVKLNTKPPLKKDEGSQLTPARINKIPTAISRTREARCPFKRNLTHASAESMSRNRTQKACLVRQVSDSHAKILRRAPGSQNTIHYCARL